MNAYREFIEPSRVSNCVGCNFISPTSKHLVVAKSTILQVFEVVKPAPQLNNKNIKLDDKSKLKLVEQFKLHGLVTDLKPIRTIESPDLDYLIVSTKAAKFSIIKWDHFSNSISTVSLHYYEHAIQNLTFEKLASSDLLVEPNTFSCACLRFKNLLTFLPFEVPDDENEEEDDDLNLSSKKSKTTELEANGTVSGDSDFFDSSFIIEATTLDPSIGTIIDMQFLHNYKEPTIAIISQKNHTWAGLLPKTKDDINFIVLSLDLNSRTSTTVLKLDNLPYDVDRLIPLPHPLNGSLLLGCNEIIHIDNGGITRRVAVNDFTPWITSSVKNYLDQSALELKLEHCSIIPLPNDNRVLMILENGQFYYINFEVDGKTIKKFSVESISNELYPDILLERPDQAAVLDDNLIVVSSNSCNTALIKVDYKSETKNGTKLIKNNVSQGPLKTNNENDDDDDDDDDLYGDEEVNEDHTFRRSEATFVLQDELVNNGPVSKFTYGHYSTQKYIANLINPNYKEISIISNGGENSSSHLNIMTPSVQPKIRTSLTFSQINRMWNINNKYLITSDDINNKSEIFQINKSFARLSSKNFINNELTIAMHELNNGKFILQITPKHVILFNNKFVQLVSLDSELENDFKNDDIINSTFNDEFLMLFFASGEVMIYSINTYNESFNKISIPKILSDTIITSGYIANSHLLNVVLKDVSLLVNRGLKRKRNMSNPSVKAKSPLPDRKSLGPKSKTFILVTGDNRIVAFSRFHNEKCFQLNEVDKFTDQLTLGFFEQKDTYPDPLIKQVLFNELGDLVSKDEYLTILTIGGEIIMYKLFFDGENYSFIKEKNLALTGAPHNAYPQGTSIERRLVYLPNFNGYTTILVSGVLPYIIMKTTSSIPRIYQFSKIPIVSFAAYSDNEISNGVIYLDTKKNARIVELPQGFIYDNNWPIRQIRFDETIKSVTYHETSNTYILSTFKEIDYDCIDEEGKPIVGTDFEKPKTKSLKGLLKLVSPLTWTVIDSIELADNEIGMNVESMILDVGTSSKRFKNKKEFIVLGTGKYRIEDLGANGSFKLYEIIDIIPEPGRPETNHKFKDFNQEDTRGAVTSICEISGRFLVAQGQKIIIRDIQDNGTIPVAFLDTSVYVSEAKSFGNLLLLGDSLKSVWLAGFDAEPFRMIMLGKDLQPLDVNCADFLTNDQEIHIVIADNNNSLHIVQYNPEDPGSSNGQRLLHKTAFNLNHSSTCMKTTPKHEEINPQTNGGQDVTFQTVGSTVDGSFYTVFPVNEATYRRMYILQQQLIDKEYHACGLNPRRNRFGGLSLSVNDTNAKPLLDYDVIKTFTSLNEDRKNNLALKVSRNVLQDIWKDFIEFECVLKHL